MLISEAPGPISLQPLHALRRGRKQRPWKSRVAVVHTWRNLRGKSRCTFEEVEKELHAKDQAELNQKRDPEEPHR